MTCRFNNTLITQVNIYTAFKLVNNPVNQFDKYGLAEDEKFGNVAYNEKYADIQFVLEE